MAKSYNPTTSIHGTSHGDKPTAETVIRLREDVYQQIEKMCYAIHVGKESTELMAGFLLGQQAVLKLLRENIVVPAV